jgi:hypothetical protein
MGRKIWIKISLLTITRVACAIGPSVTRPQLIFPSKTWFFGIYLNFQGQKSLRNQFFPPSESKSYQINSIKSCSSRSFQQHQRHIPIPQIFWMKKSFNIQELLLCNSKCHETKPMHPSSSRAFQRDQEHHLKHPSSLDLISTKQNNLTTLLHR